MSKIDKNIDLSGLPTYYKGIDWRNSVGYKIPFIYGDIDGELEIIEYIDDNLMKVKYKNCISTIHKDCIKRCSIGSVIGVYNIKYLYGVGDIINVTSGEIIILKQINIADKNNHNHRGYMVKCKNHSHEFPILETKIKQGHGCPVCANQVVIKGINDMATTYPISLNFVLDINDAYKYTYKSKMHIVFKCPDCGFEKEMKISDFTTDGFSCNKCGDGISYPNKFAFNLLEQLGLDFIPEYNPDWIKPKKYDFFFIYKNKNYILEMDGGWHNRRNTLSGKSKEKSIEDDEYKDLMAKQNNIHIIRVNSDRSRLNVIKENILNSELSELFDLSQIDWIECEKNACSSKVKIASDYWNSGIHSTTEIGDIMKLNNNTITRYLKIAVNIGICDYSVKEARKAQIEKSRMSIIQIKSIPILCLETNQVFSSMNYCSCNSEQILKKRLNNKTIYNVLKGVQLKTKGFTFQYISRQEFNTIKSQSPELAFGDFFISTEEQQAL